MAAQPQLLRTLQNNGMTQGWVGGGGVTYWHVLKKFYPYWYVLLIVLVCNLVGIGMYFKLYWYVSGRVLASIDDYIGMYCRQYWYVIW